jgi:hypothetical protein
MVRGHAQRPCGCEQPPSQQALGVYLSGLCHDARHAADGGGAGIVGMVKTRESNE